MKNRSNHHETEWAQAWSRDGFFVIPDLLSEEECEAFKKEGLEILRRDARPGATVHVGCAVTSERFANLAADPRIVEPLRPLMPGGIEFLSDKLVCKKPGKAFPTPWHIDAWYWKGTRPKISVWIPFEETTAENGTLIVLPGSHLREWNPRETKGVNGEFTNELAETDLPAPGRVHVCNLTRGSAVFFSDRLLHGSTASAGERERYAIISTYHAPGHEPFDDRFLARRALS